MLTETRARIARLGRPVQLLMISEVLTVFSLLMGHLAVAWWVSREGGAADLALYGVVMAVTAFIGMPLLSPLADRYPKRTLLGAGLAVFSVETVLLSALAQFGGYRLWPVLGLEMVAVLALAVMQPAAMSIAAELVAPARLAEAFALQKTAQALGRMLGPALCGLVLALAGVQTALWLHAALFVLATWAAFRIPAGSFCAPAAARDWRAELLGGLRAKWQIPVERYWTVMAFFTMVFFGPAIGLLVPLRVQSLHWSAAWLGICEAALSAGMLLGALHTARALTERFGRFAVAIGALLGEGVALGLVGVLDARWAVPLCFFSTGLCLSMMQLIGQTHRMLAVPDSHRGRFSACNLMVMHFAGAVGPALTGALLLHSQPGQVYLLFGLALLACAACYPWLPGFRQFLALDHASAKNWYGRHYPQAFGLTAKPAAQS